jgi:hypothetical protein
MTSSLQALFIGTAIPLASSILPVRTALKKTINESLDMTRSKTQAISVNILMTNKKDVSTLIIFGMIALSYGFSVYYLLPLSLVSFNFSLATSIFFGILFGMIVGLGLLSINLLPILNSIVARIIMLFEKAGTRQLVLKNLIAHR